MGELVQFFSQGSFFHALPQFPAEKTVTLPLVWPKKVMTFPMQKDNITGIIIKRDQLLPCAVHNRTRVALLPDLVQVVINARGIVIMVLIAPSSSSELEEQISANTKSTSSS